MWGEGRKPTLRKHGHHARLRGQADLIALRGELAQMLRSVEEERVGECRIVESYRAAIACALR